MVDGLPRREIVGQQAPSTPATHDVEDGIDDLAEGVHPGSPGSFGGREMGFYVRPLGIGEVGLVCSSHARYSTEPLSQKPFSDSFRRCIPGSSARSTYRSLNSSVRYPSSEGVSEPIKTIIRGS
jgi:hypothetical protein